MALQGQSSTLSKMGMAQNGIAWTVLHPVQDGNGKEWHRMDSHPPCPRWEWQGMASHGQSSTLSEMGMARNGITQTVIHPILDENGKKWHRKDSPRWE